MIRHGRTGCLFNDEDDMAVQIARLIQDPSYRRALVGQARHVVETELADPETWWHQWKTLLNEAYPATKRQAASGG